MVYLTPSPAAADMTYASGKAKRNYKKQAAGTTCTVLWYLYHRTLTMGATDGPAVILNIMAALSTLSMVSTATTAVHL